MNVVSETVYHFNLRCGRGSVVFNQEELAGLYFDTPKWIFKGVVLYLSTPKNTRQWNGEIVYIAIV